MASTELKVFSSEKTPPVFGNGNLNEHLKIAPTFQHRITKLWIVAGLLGAACVTIVVLVLILLTGVICNSDSNSLFNKSTVQNVSTDTLSTERQPAMRSDFNTTGRKSFKEYDLTNCGYTGMGRIFNGNEAALGQFPWMVLLIDDTDKIYCGGTLISDRYVLTAAHCAKDVKTVRLGEHNLTSEIDCADIYREDCSFPVQNFTVMKTDIIEHPDYSSSTMKNDIALIRFTRPANMTNNRVFPICLPYGKFKDAQDILEDTRLFIAGWGYTGSGTMSNVLRHAPVIIKSNRYCMKEFNLDSTVLDDRNICTTGENGQNHCFGDSGGPLQLIKNVKIGNRSQTVTVQQGIITLGKYECTLDNPSVPDVYIKVSSYMDWILNNIEE